ncbi:cyanophycinase [Taibaiella lutea]|uniref:Cyanophycinase n=1 Tax=Taibaiella lutea TaxID=2608001 RepID=A0A5M6CM87_9BACT|nr:cyanophycinase [Taibaiella lutea]KAA5536163.1 cyanophycinase [Taibaiella lutea]
MGNDKNGTFQVPQGTLLVIGGHEDKCVEHESQRDKPNYQPMEILNEFIQLIGKGKPIVEVITTACADGIEIFNVYKEAFNQLGVDNVGHIHHTQRSEILAENVDERIEKADGIFFTGGDQLRLTSIYGGTSLLRILKYRYMNDNIVLAGTSAGAMALSSPMIYAGNKTRQQLAGGVRTTTGLDFLKHVCIDTHFVDRSRFVRMAQVIAMNPGSIGIGIEEDTAVIIRSGTDIEVVGNGIVIVVDGRGITESNVMEYDSGKSISIKDLNVKLLAKGCNFNLKEAALVFEKNAELSDSYRMVSQTAMT